MFPKLFWSIILSVRTMSVLVFSRNSNFTLNIALILIFSLQNRLFQIELKFLLILLFVFITVIIINKWIFCFCRSLLIQLGIYKLLSQAGSYMMVSNYSCLFKIVGYISPFSFIIVPQFYKPHMWPFYSAFSITNQSVKPCNGIWHVIY